MQERPEPASLPGQVAPSRVFYGWYIVAAGSVSSFIGVAIFMHSMGAFIPEMRDEFGWSMAAISFGFSLKQFEHGLLAPVTGYLIDRLGPRLMATIGVIVMTAGLILFARMNSLWMFYLAATVMAVGQGMGSTTAFSAAIMHWFVRRRGQASSILAMGFGSGYIGVYPVTLLMILFGWRQAATIAALFFFATGLPLAQVIRHRPEPYGYLPDGNQSPATTGDPGTRQVQGIEADSFTVKDALRSTTFWLVLFATSVFNFHTGLYNVHIIPHMRNVGFSAKGAATVIALYGVTQTIGRPLWGWVGDRIGRYRVVMMSHLIMGIGWVAIAFVSSGNFWTVALYFVAFAPGHAAHQSNHQAVMADFFGTRRYATIRGLMSSLALVGGVLGPIFAGRMFDVYGNYRRAFLIIAPIAAVGAPAIFLAGKPTLAGGPAPAGEAQRSRS